MSYTQTRNTTIKVSPETLGNLKNAKIQYMAKNKISKMSDNDFIDSILQKVNKK